MMSVVARVSLAAALLGSFVAPIVAVSYLHTPEGIESLDQPSVAFWANPATDLLAPLLDGAGADRVYLVGTQLMGAIWLATLAAAIATARRRSPVGLERAWWSIALIGYVWFAVGLVGFGVLADLLSPAHPAADAVFMAAMLPGLLTSLIGSSLLGVALVRARYPVRGASWLLALAVPLWLFANLVVGHNSIGLLPLLWAWALASRSVVLPSRLAAARR
jgi:hypothetical protein